VLFAAPCRTLSQSFPQVARSSQVSLSFSAFIIAFGPYLNDELTKRVKRALKSGRKMRIDADGRSVDVKTGELIGPDPAIEQPPLTRAQLGKAVVRRPAQSRSQADHDAATRPGSPETFP
jgi:hypothetical protein